MILRSIIKRLIDQIEAANIGEKLNLIAIVLTITKNKQIKIYTSLFIS
jgi:hypothetical protein